MQATCWLASQNLSEALQALRSQDAGLTSSIEFLKQTFEKARVQGAQRPC
jgi:hypothetical protein